MEVLILTCGTGGGHNAAAEALREELERRGDRAVLMNPYTLRGERTVRRIDKTYITLAQKAPKGFGVVYSLGEAYRRLPGHSPVYHINRKAARAMRDFLSKNHFDAILMTHLYPAEIMTLLRHRRFPLPATIFVATDYACIPFTEETRCDAYVIPHPDLLGEFRARGIPAAKLYPLGIPVRQAFTQPVDKARARQLLGLDKEETYLLVSGGSMGAGVLKKAVRELYGQWDGKGRLIVICGTNDKLYRELQKQYGGQLDLLRSTDRMALYLQACDLYFTKPGGLSSTEAAVVGTGLVHLPPIPGCETKNARFFARHGLSLTAGQALSDPRRLAQSLQRQKKAIPGDAARRICNLAQALAEKH